MSIKFRVQPPSKKDKDHGKYYKLRSVVLGDTLWIQPVSTPGRHCNSEKEVKISNFEGDYDYTKRKGQNCNPGNEINISGRGQTATRHFTLKRGQATITMSMRTTAHTSSFNVRLYDDKGNRVGTSLMNDSGKNVSGSKIVRIDKTGMYRLQVSTGDRSSWNITIK